MRTCLWILLLVMLSSCSIFDGNEIHQIELKKYWEVVEFFDADGNQIALKQDELLTLRFSSENELGGEADCNFFGGEYRAKVNGDLVIKNLVSTEIACEQPTLGDSYLEALAEASGYKREKGELFIYYTGKGTLKYFERLE